MPEPEYKLWYHCENNGDGSASVHFHQHEGDAENADEHQADPWGESSVGAATLKMVDGQLCFETLMFIPAKGKTPDHYKTVWKHVSKVVPK